MSLTDSCTAFTLTMARASPTSSRPCPSGLASRSTGPMNLALLATRAAQQRVVPLKRGSFEDRTSAFSTNGFSRRHGVACEARVALVRDGLSRGRRGDHTMPARALRRALVTLRLARTPATWVALLQSVLPALGGDWTIAASRPQGRVWQMHLWRWPRRPVHLASRRPRRRQRASAESELVKSAHGGHGKKASKADGDSRGCDGRRSAQLMHLGGRCAGRVVLPHRW